MNPLYRPDINQLKATLSNKIKRESPGKELVVLAHYCAKDHRLMEKVLKWIAELDNSLDFDLLLACDDEIPIPRQMEMMEIAEKAFRRVSRITYEPPRLKSWPQAPNHAFLMCSLAMLAINRPFLWVESDVTPIKSGWLTDLSEEYSRCKQPFMGHIVLGVVSQGHMTGCGIYPANTFSVCKSMHANTNVAWDVMASSNMAGKIHQTRLIQHIWNVDLHGNPTFGPGEVPRYHKLEDVTDGPHRINFTCSFMHRCKDGSAIDYLRQMRSEADPEKMVPKHGVGWVEDEPDVKVPGNVVGLIVTYAKDVPWLEYSLMSWKKFCSGFAGLTLAVPRGTFDEIKLSREAASAVTDVHFYDEIKGKGMVQHQERMGFADEICPKADFVIHFDADCMWLMPTTPAYYFREGKPVYVWRTYDSLINIGGVVSDCYQWKKVAEKALGHPINEYTMCRHPTVLPRGFYKPYRDHITKATGQDFSKYVISQRNPFPQTFADFPTMGAFAWHHLHDAFHWYDCGTLDKLVDRMKNYWSHGGLDQKGYTPGKTAKQEIEDLLKG